MNRKSLILLLALLAGCHEEGNPSSSEAGDFGTGGDTVDPPPGGGQTSLQENFSGAFPGSTWIVDTGGPAIVENLGNPAPSLILEDPSVEMRFRSVATFAATPPFSVSFDLSIPAPKSATSRFDVRLQAETGASTSASFVVPEQPSVIRAQIGSTEEEIPFTPDGSFHTFKLTVDSDRIATWSIDGGVVQTVTDFPQATFRLEIVSHADASSSFLLDNVTVSRP